MKERREKHTCLACKKDFIVVWKILPSKLDDKRASYYTCPYCDEKYDVKLLENEEIDVEKLIK